MSVTVLDSHAHLTSPEFTSDLGDVLARAAAAGVGPVVCVSCNPDDARNALALSQQYPEIVRASAGLHPEEVSRMDDAAAEAAVEALCELVGASPGRFVAVGEVGLDFTPRVLDGVGGPDAVRKRQRRVLRRCLALAREHALPASVHSRGAGRHAVEMLEGPDGEGVRAVLHAFDGRAVYAERAVGSGRMWFSVPPCVVRSRQLQKMVRRVPLESLLIETDSPVLGIEPRCRNEPSQAQKSVEMISILKGVQLERTTHILATTARQVFPRALGVETTPADCQKYVAN